MSRLTYTVALLALLVGLTTGALALTLDERIAILEQRAEAQIDDEKWDEALESAQYAVRLAPESADAWALLALARAMHPGSTLESAAQAAQRARSLDPVNRRPHYVFALLKWWTGDLPGAEAKCREALLLDPTSARLHELLGMVLSDQGKGEAGTAALREATRLAPRSFDAHLNLAWTLYADGHVDEALDENEIALSLAWTTPDKAFAHNNAAYFHAAKRHGADALREARAAQALLPDDPYVADTLGAMLALFGDPQEAVAALHESLALKAPRPASAAALAYALTLLGRDDEARAQLAAISADLVAEDVEVDTLCFAGRAYAELGESVIAGRIFRRAAERWPRHPLSAEMRGYLDEGK